MKRILAIILVFILCLSIASCAKDEVTIENPVSFYYRRSELSYEGNSGVIMQEIRESGGSEQSIITLLSLYFQGPVATGMDRTFPYGTQPISLQIQDNRAYITTTSHFANLKGIDLSIACACITMTLIELTGVSSVEIKADRSLLNDAESIIMDKETLLLLDDAVLDAAI